MNKILSIYTFFVFLFCFSDSLANSAFNQAYNKKTGQTSVSYDSEDCGATLTVFDKSSINSNILKVRTVCSLSFLFEAGLVSILLSELKLQGLLNDVNTISWGSMNSQELKERFALAALSSKAWAELTENGIKSRLPKNIPEAKDILNSGKVFKELFGVLRAMGFNASVSATNGVLVDKLKNVTTQKPSDIDDNYVVPTSAIVWFNIELLK